MCQRGKKHFEVHFWRIRFVLFPSKDGKNAAYDGSNGWKSVCFPPESASCAFVDKMIKVLFLFCNLTWRLNNYVCRQREGVNRRNKSTIILMKYCTVIYNHFSSNFQFDQLLLIGNLLFWKTTFSVALKTIWDAKNSISATVEIFPSSRIMATLWNQKKLAALSREIQEYPKNNQSQNLAAPGITQDLTAQLSEESKGRVTTKLTQEVSSTESRILGAMSKLDEFLLNAWIRTFSWTLPRTFPSADVENQEPSGDLSQIYPHPEVEFSACRASNLIDSDPDETSHKVTGVQEEIPY